MEQALVFASIILGVAVASELGNLHHLIRAKNVRWHWAQPLFAVLVIFFITRFWWTLAADTDRAITLGEFVPILWSLVLLTLLASVALPDKIDPEKGIDLAQYYQDNRRYQWGLILLIALPLQGAWMLGVWQESETVARFLERTMGDNIAWALMIAMMFVKRWWLVAIGMAIISLGPIAWLSRTLG
ncbi:hypothetical protein [Aurantiacibacter marinus]|uniref:Uncharacterized protein n=1 Tax=Aurantiacibacter marinus TaxID=874156 RepID=A0A0H0XLG0_9SPHN|nr:hypothetical protein [Aurantiacibacter marinus]KLI63204.1 hypothetical protein AAV99_11035 [Aurantiacibacter marinus]